MTKNPEYSPPPPLDVYVACLKRERQGYVNRGLPDRVAQVDAELARVSGSHRAGRGVETATDAGAETATATRKRAGRRTD
jgi:hypothetical protein